MPKKRNFLGGMQNYNAQTGEYEPALKGPNGESPSGFKSFKKQEDKDESFDTINKKRMGKEEKINFDSDYYKIKSPEITNTDAYLTAPIVSALEKAEGRTLENDELRQIVKNMASKNPNATPEEFEKMLLEYKGGLLGSNNDFTSEDYVDDFYDRVSDLQKEVNTSGIDDDEYDAEINKLKEELETKKDSMSEDDYNKAKEMLDRFSRPTDDDFDANDEVTDDEISEHLADYQWQVTPKTTAGQYAQECADRLGISKERVFNIIKQQAPDQIKESSNMSKIIDAGEEDYEYIDDDNGSFDQINAKRMGKETKSIDKELEKAKKRVYKFMPDLPSKKAMVSEMEGLLARFKSGNRPEEMLKTAKDNIQKWQRSRELDTNDLRDERLAYFEKIVDYMEKNL